MSDINTHGKGARGLCSGVKRGLKSEYAIEQ